MLPPVIFMCEGWNELVLLMPLIVPALDPFPLLLIERVAVEALFRNKLLGNALEKSMGTAKSLPPRTAPTGPNRARSTVIGYSRTLAAVIA